jgi:cold shock CspA family protein
MSNSCKKNELGWLPKPLEAICFIYPIQNFRRKFSLDPSNVYIYFNLDKTFSSKENILVEYQLSDQKKEFEIEGEKKILSIVQNLNHLFIGYIESFNSEKGFGIVKSSYDDFFLHVSNIREGDYLRENDLVIFEATFSREKFQAIKCKLIKEKPLENDSLKNQLVCMINSLDIDEFKNVIKNNHNFFKNALKNLFHDIKSKEDIFQLGLEQVVNIKDIVILKEILHTKNVFKKFLNREPYNLIPDLSALKLSIKDTNEFIEIIFKIFYDLPEFTTEEDFNLIDNIIILTEYVYPDAKQKIISYILSHSRDQLLLNLYLEDTIENIPIKNLFYLFPILGFEFQKRFFKKLFVEIQKKDSQIDKTDILNLPVMDIETSKLAEKLDGNTLDYSISIIISVLKNLELNLGINKTLNLIESSMYNIIESFLNNLKEPLNIIEITGFFDECQGRCSIFAIEHTNDMGITTYSDFSFQRDFKDKYSPPFYCDGRKNTDSKTGNPILDNKYKVEFWWCQNRVCYSPSRELHTKEKYQDYTLQDFLNILKIPYKLEDYELLLGLINKTNRFFRHMQCKSCKQILHPKKQSEFGFWRINLFQCKNPKCNNNEEIYLSHCLNGRCDNIIDSRISQRCNYSNQNPPDYVSHGLYICNKCSACCNEDTLKRIYEKGNLNQVLLNSLEWRIKNKASHQERKEVFCYKCGSLMINSNNEYQKILAWLIENKDKNKSIVNSGIRPSDEKHWFRLKANKDKFENLKRIGFDVSDDYTPGIALVSEKIKYSGNFWYCSNDQCGIAFNGEKELYTDYVSEMLDHEYFKQEIKVERKRRRHN